MARVRVHCLAIVAVLLAGCAGVWGGAVPVTVEPTGDGYRLLRDGKPYRILGAGGQGHLDLAVASGANSIRTWGSDGVGRILDEAQRRGLTVAVGLWMGHPRHGFDYGDAERVAAQQEKFRAVVEQYRDHPAVLVWGIGNEMELDSRGTDERVWKAVNEIAVMIKALDTNHPTMTVIAEVGGPRIAMLNQHCPDVDIIGINAYAGLPSLSERIRERGLRRPYIVTEYNRVAAGETAWGAVRELSSSQKAANYLAYHEQHIRTDPWCLGSYAFKWGQKHERTATYGNLFLASGEKVNGVDSLAFAWTGQWPANRCPQIEPMQLNTPDRVPPETAMQARFEVEDPEGDPLAIEWELRSEKAGRSVGGDREKEPKVHWTRQTQQPEIAFTAPPEPGPYRLFVYVRDGQGGAATANLPFLVESTGGTN